MRPAPLFDVCRQSRRPKCHERMRYDFSGIRYKLQRSHENILSLETEVETFLRSGDYPPMLPYEDKELLYKGMEYHQRRTIPLRYSVLAGEIIHQLRSCLDHVAWQFSGDWYRKSKPRQIEFPILEKWPTKRDAVETYRRKTRGIADAGALMLIEALQPYNRTIPEYSQLLMIHNMDIADKHRELLLCGFTAAFNIPMEVFERFMSYELRQPGSSPVDVGAEFKRNPYLYAQVAFKEFGTQRNEPLVQGLGELHNTVLKAVDIFQGLTTYVDPFPYE
jgi:hypothetical protein